MNSDLFPPTTLPTDVSDAGASETQTPLPATTAETADPTTPARRGRGRRAATPSTDPTASTTTDGDARSRRSRRGASTSSAPSAPSAPSAAADLPTDATIPTPDSGLSRSPAIGDTDDSPLSRSPILPTMLGTTAPLDTVDAGTDDMTTPATRSRRRRGRGHAAATDTADGATTDATADTALPTTETSDAADIAQASAQARRASLEANILTAATEALIDAQETQDVGSALPDDDEDPFGETETETEGETATALDTVGATANGRRRRRRNRGNRTGTLDVGAPDALSADAVPTALDATNDALEIDEGIGAISPTSAAPPDDTAMEPQPDLSDLSAAIQPEPDVALSPAILRRFDHREWRRQPRQPQQPQQPRQPRQAPQLGADRPTSSVATAANGSAFASPTPSIAATALAPAAAPFVVDPMSPAPTPVPFERPERGRRFGNRDRDRRREPSYVEPTIVATQSSPPDPMPAEIVTEIPTAVPAIPEPQRQPAAAGIGPATTAPIVEPSAALSYRSPATIAPTIEQAAPASYRSPMTPGATLPTAQPVSTTLPVGRGLEELLERVLTGQTALLQQQQQTLQALASSVASLQESIERMSTVGIAAGMPRAGLFVDAPNVVYAAENARVNIDYGRMLDFLGRGREMVHSIVYAPVTEENIHRPDLQRFVAPFLGKGYKMVTKPLKRFPDGTAKGNFDIELAIDIVTMSQRLDVVILISGDSDFTRLIELIQSRGVRVEVASFASNVSWELIQMADVFIDIGQYLDEFRQV